MSEESDIQAELDSLPKGTIVRRTIRGTDRFYHQWRENGVTKSRYLSPGEIMPLRAQLERRHELLSFGSISQKMKQSSKTRNRTFQCDVLTGRFLAEYAASVGHDKKRDCYFTLFNITRQQTGSVPSLFLVGPRGTGKTTLLRQFIHSSVNERKRQNRPVFS